MNREQSKVKKFFHKFIGNMVNHILSWFGVGFCVLLLGVASLLPVQIIFDDFQESISMLLLIVVCGPLAGSLRIMPYQSYGISPNDRRVSEILKYHPINRTEIKKLECMVLIRFMAKVAAVCMLLQMSVAFYEYGGLSWVNVLYIFIVMFLYPFGVNALSIYLEK